MAVTSISGLMACALVTIAIPMQALNIARLSLAARLSVFAVLAAAMAIPIDGLMIAGYVRGLIGDPSVATIAVMSLMIIKQLTRRDPCDDRDISALLFIVLASGGLLYPMAMGLSPYDPFALGFGSWTMYAVLFTIAVAAWWARLNLIVWWLVASLLAFSLGLFESTNLWNYLIDPIVVLIAVGWTAIKLFQCLRGAAFQNETAIA